MSIPVPFGQNQGLWRHFGDTMSPGLVGVFSAPEEGGFARVMSSVYSFCLWQFCSPFLGFSRFVRGFVKVDSGMYNI